MGSSTSNAKGPELPCDDGKCDGPELDEGHFEFVVVGSGAGGGPLAASLARAGHRTLLLEAGAWPGGSLTYSIPALHPQASEDPELSWSFLVDHYGSDPDAAARDTKMVWDERTFEAEGIFYPRGSAVGGSTAVNAMITMTPHDSDWNYIADLTGDDSWRADHMRRYFTRIERNRYLERHGSEAEGHGFDGWLSTEQPDASIGLKDRRLRRQVTAAAFVAGDGLFEDIHQLFGLLDRDINAPGPERDAMEGVFGGAMATDGGRRNGTAEYLRRTIDEGYPLTLRTRSLVTNVVWADESAEDGTPVAVGVEYLEGGSLYGADRRAADALGSLPERRRVTVTREVILSAGAFNTPQLLKLSGVGPAAELDALGIETRVDLPGVGTNLQDRYEVGVVTEAPGPYSATLPCSFDTSVEDECMEKWRTGEGPYTANGPAVALIQRSSVAVHDPDLFIFGLPGFFKGYYPGYSADIAENRALFTWLILKGHTRNQAGTVTLRSTDPRVPPHIDFDYFRQGAGHDLQAMVEGVHTIRSIIDKVNDLTLFGRDTVEVWPGAEADTDDEVAQWVRDEAWGHHASCSAPIGRDGDGMAVLDSRFRVRGTTGLRVVDASVFPRIPGFFIAVPTMMVSEKAADVILADLGEPRDGRFVDHADVDIPDMDELGVVREIEIPESMGTVSGLSITIDIEHTWRGDLRIVLERDGREVVLLEHEGSSRDDVHTTVVVDEFDGEAAAGTWRLRVADRVRADLGTLRSWSINLGG